MARMAELQKETRVTGRPLAWQVSPEDLQNIMARAQAERAKVVAKTARWITKSLWRDSGLAAVTGFLNRGVTAPLMRGLRQAQARRALSQLDDRLLLDIGIRRDQICEVVAQTGQRGTSAQGIWSSFRVWLAKSADRRQTVRQLSALSDRMLQDIGMLRGEIPEAATRLVASKYAKSEPNSVSNDAVTETAKSLRKWQLSRKAAGEMARMDPDILADIGYVKGDIDWVPEVLAERKLTAANLNFGGERAA